MKQVFMVRVRIFYLAALTMLTAPLLVLGVPKTVKAQASYKGFSQGQCTYYAAMEFDKVTPAPGLNWRGNANQWFANAAGNGWQTSSNPRDARRGALIVWDDGGYGHVAIVRSVGTNNIVIEEMNWPIGAGVRSTTINYPTLNRGSYMFRGFIFPKTPAIPTDTTPPIGAMDAPYRDGQIVSDRFGFAGWARDDDRDDTGVRDVRILLDGTDKGTASPVHREDNNPGFAAECNFTTVGVGNHTLTMRITDNAGNVTNISRTIVVSHDYQLLRGLGENTVFLVTGGSRYPIGSWKQLEELNVRNQPVQDVSRPNINQYNLGSPLPHLITPNNSDIYYVQDGYARHVMNWSLMDFMNFRREDVVSVSPERFNTYSRWKDLSQNEPRLIAVNGPTLPPPSLCYVGAAVSFDMTVRNMTAGATTADHIVLSMRGADGSVQDIWGTSNVSLPPGQDILIHGTRTFAQAGRYSVNGGAFCFQGDWHGISSSGLSPDGAGYIDILPSDPVIRVATDAASIVPDSSVTGSVTLAGPAPSGGTAINITTNNSAISVSPSVVNIPAGSSSGVFTVAASSNAQPGSVTVTAASAGTAARTTDLAITANQTPIQPVFSASTMAVPNTIAPGGTTAISATITNNGGVVTGTVVDLEVYNAAGQQVGQRFFESQSFAAGESRQFNLPWTSAATGVYTVKVGIFSSNWANLLYWNDNASAVTTAPANAVRYDFESTTMGWQTTGGMLFSLDVVPDQAFTGTKSLAVHFNGSTADTQQVYLSNPVVSVGNTAVFRVYIPTGSRVIALQPYLLQGEAGGWAWTGNYQTMANLTPGSWNTVSITVPQGAILPLAQLGVQFFTDGPWTGTCYLDTVTW